MSIATRTGDLGTTSLMYNRRVSKCHPRVEAIGCVDELNAALGLARAGAMPGTMNDQLFRIQQDLVVLMGELATAVEDLPQYEKDGFRRVGPELCGKLDELVEAIERQAVTLQGWATPGANPTAAALDLARTICRRAERRVCALQEAGQLDNPKIVSYLNRLSDALWLLARWVETQPGLGR
jgi:cob(I)alamin adenosyltransferase